MATPVLYAALTDLKDRLSIDDNDRDFALERCLDGACRWIERETAHRFYPTTQTRYYTAERGNLAPPSDISERPGGGSWFVGFGGTAQYLGIDDLVVLLDAFDAPIYPTIATDWDGDGVYETAWTYGTDFWLGPRNAAADGKPYRFLQRTWPTGRYYFPWYQNGISVTGAFGYCDTVPSDIRELSLDIAELYARPVIDLSMAGVMTYKIGDISATMKSEELPPMAQRTLAAYKQSPL